MSIESFFSKIVKDFENLFSIHSSQINTAIADAQAGLAAANSIAVVLGEPTTVTDVIAKASDGLGLILTASITPLMKGVGWLPDLMHLAFLSLGAGNS